MNKTKCEDRLPLKHISSQDLVGVYLITCQ